VGYVDRGDERFETARAGQIGSGPRHRFPEPRLLAAILGRGIGCEVMETGAACRTYNVLVSEDRRAVAALLLK